MRRNEYPTEHELKNKTSGVCAVCDGAQYCERKDAMCRFARWYQNSKNRNWKKYRKNRYK
jgi:hypothetical protein